MTSSESALFSTCSQQLNVLNLVIYKPHGLNNNNNINNGRSMLSELYDDRNTFIVAVQEHWLTDNNLHLLNNIHPDFASCGISAMSKRLNKGIYRG